MTNLKKTFTDAQSSAFREKDPDGLGMIHKHEIVLDMILRYSEKSSRILDVGCSDGKILKDLESRGYKKLYGVDIQSVSDATFIGTNIKYKKCDVENEPIPFRGSFDLIIISDVLEHMFSPQTVLFDIRSILSEKGMIVFSVPNAGWFLNGLLLTFLPSKLFVSTAFGPWGHTHQFTFYEVKKISATLKFKVIELQGGRLDNYAFRSGIKKLLFDLFVLLTSPLATRLPSAFSAHIFGIIQKSRKSPPQSSRFDLGL